VESQFAIAAITSDATKYHQVIASLEPQYLVHIADISRDPPSINKYETIKAALTKEYTDSVERKLNMLIHEVQLGDLRPSQLLKRMKALAGNIISDRVLKTLWMEKIPNNVRAIVSIVDGDLAKVALQADKIMEAQCKPTISTAQASNEDREAEIEALRREIKKLRAKASPDDRSHSSSDNPPARSPFCYYHGRFGAKTKKCTQPCEFYKLNAKN